jgi:NAD(P)-dependent dehydrogenase (short-subunit alcohol dehydrogenase family)
MTEDVELSPAARAKRLLHRPTCAVDSRRNTAGLAAINSAIEGLVKPLAVELKPRRVNAVSPGVVDTPWWNWMAEDQKQAAFDKFARATPVGRVGRPSDIAQSIVFLIGNSFMTGCILACDGGLRLVGQSL